MSKSNRCIAYGLAGFLAGAIAVLAVSAFAQSRQQYRVVEYVGFSAVAELENSLNQEAAQGWHLHSYVNIYFRGRPGGTGVFILERK